MRQDERTSLRDSRAGSGAYDFDASDALTGYTADALLEVPSVISGVLASQKRRAVLEYLIEHDDPDPVAVEEETSKCP